PFSLKSGGSMRSRPVPVCVDISLLFYSLAMPTTDHRQTARPHVYSLIARRRTLPDQKGVAALVEEAEALARAISAFHMEGIRFRIYNVDRLVQHPPVPLPPEAPAIVADVRKHLEAAGFHTRSHQSPV